MKEIQNFEKVTFKNCSEILMLILFFYFEKVNFMSFAHWEAHWVQANKSAWFSIMC